MPKLPKCAYAKGDLVRHDGAMGIVTSADGQFYTYQLLGAANYSHTTMNVSIRHYLKLVKAEHQVRSGQGRSADFVVRNLTLEEQLIESDPQPLIAGTINRLAEDTINKTVEQGE